MSGGKNVSIIVDNISHDHNSRVEIPVTRSRTMIQRRCLELHKAQCRIRQVHRAWFNKQVRSRTKYKICCVKMV